MKPIDVMKRALDALYGAIPPPGEEGEEYDDAIRDLSSLIDEMEAVAVQKWQWKETPTKTSWGSTMVLVDLKIDKDHTATLYCEKSQKNKVEAMFCVQPKT